MGPEHAENSNTDADDAGARGAADPRAREPSSNAAAFPRGMVFILVGAAALSGYAIWQRTSSREIVEEGGETVSRSHRTSSDPRHSVQDDTLADGDSRDAALPETVERLERLIAEEPDRAEAHYQLANALVETGELSLAIVHYRRAIEINPGAIQPHIMLGNALLRLSERDGEAAIREEAEAVFRVAAGSEFASATAADRASASFNLANSLFQRRAHAEAAVRYRNAIELAPDHAAAHASLGACQIHLRNYPAAIEALIVAVRLDYENRGAWYHLGNAYEHVGRLADAVDAYRTAADLEPQGILIRLRLAEVAEKCGRTGDAVHALEEAITLKPELATARASLERLRGMHGE